MGPRFLVVTHVSICLLLVSITQVAPQTYTPPPGRSMRTVQGVHLILERRTPSGCGPELLTYAGWPPCPRPLITRRHFGRAILGNLALFVVSPLFELPKPAEVGLGLATCFWHTPIQGALKMPKTWKIVGLRRLQTHLSQPADADRFTRPRHPLNQ